LARRPCGRSSWMASSLFPQDRRSSRSLFCSRIRRSDGGQSKARSGTYFCWSGCLRSGSLCGPGHKGHRSDQTQLTHAASAYDVLAAMRMLATQPNIDGQRIGALGHSRGGAAVLLAVHQQMTRAVLGEGRSLKAVLVGWPLCVFQFEHALTAPRWCVSWLAIRIIGPRQPIAKDRQRPCEPTIHRFLSAF